MLSPRKESIPQSVPRFTVGQLGDRRVIFLSLARIVGGETLSVVVDIHRAIRTLLSESTEAVS